jgi:hypothetical protein
VERTPWSAAGASPASQYRREQPARGPAADQGVRPTNTEHSNIRSRFPPYSGVKVISQLVEYFLARGALSSHQLEALAQQGFCEPPEPVANLPEPVWDEPSTPAPKPKRRGGPSRSKKPVLEQAALAAWIARSIPKWEPALEALLPISRATTLERAAIVIRNAGLSQLRDTLREGLKRQAFTPEALCTAVSFDRYRHPGPCGKGPVAVAYRAILRCDPAVKGSKYAWLLKEPAVRWVYNIALAQRRLLAAIRPE